MTQNCVECNPFHFSHELNDAIKHIPSINHRPILSGKMWQVWNYVCVLVCKLCRAEYTYFASMHLFVECGLRPRFQLNRYYIFYTYMLYARIINFRKIFYIFLHFNSISFDGILFGPVQRFTDFGRWRVTFCHIVITIIWKISLPVFSDLVFTMCHFVCNAAVTQWTLEKMAKCSFWMQTNFFKREKKRENVLGRAKSIQQVKINCENN